MLYRSVTAQARDERQIKTTLFPLSPSNHARLNLRFFISFLIFLFSLPPLASTQNYLEPSRLTTWWRGIIYACEGEIVGSPHRVFLGLTLNPLLQPGLSLPTSTILIHAIVQISLMSKIVFSKAKFWITIGKNISFWYSVPYIHFFDNGMLITV